jgi:CRISPR-associated protein Csm4
MNCYRITLRSQSSLASSFKGDMLFGQLCWMLRDRMGDTTLTTLLEGYTHNRPFLVVGDPLPQHTIQRPPVPLHRLGIKLDAERRKDFKRKSVLSLTALEKNRWRLDASFLQAETNKTNPEYLPVSSIRMRNSIDRLTGTTGEGNDPFANTTVDYLNGENQPASFTSYVLLDERLSLEDFRSTLEFIGKTGFGKDASVGRGRFSVTHMEPVQVGSPDGNALITLAPAVLSQQDFSTVYYKPFTRFGKHGAQVGHSMVWKTPVLMADSFALVPNTSPQPFIGRGLGGDGSLSVAMKETVHQGYAPTISIHLGGLS